MTRILAIALAAIFLAGAVPATAQQYAQVPCLIAPKKAPEMIAKTHGEAPIFIGGIAVEEEMFRVRLYFNPDTGTFSLFMVNPKGGLCVIMTGEGAEIEYIAPGSGS